MRVLTLYESKGLMFICLTNSYLYILLQQSFKNQNASYYTYVGT